MSDCSRFRALRLKEWDCTPLDLRAIVLDGIRWRRFSTGRLSYDYDGRSRVRVNGTLYSRPFAAVLAVTNTGTKYRRIRTQCPRCSRWAMWVLVAPDHTIGCADCLPLYRSERWWTAAPYRRSKSALLAALTGPDVVAQRRAMKALELGPIRLGRKRVNPTRRQLSYPDAWQHDEEMQEIRLMLTGKWPWE
jgi:hypothetical protein